MSFYKGEINIKDIANMKNAKNVNGILNLQIQIEMYLKLNIKIEN